MTITSNKNANKKTGDSSGRKSKDSQQSSKSGDLNKLGKSFSFESKDSENNNNSSSTEEASPKLDTEDKFKKFENEGVVFKAKLIGSELVMEPRGDKMCQNSIQRLKAIIKGTNSHKKRIVLKISFDGVKVFDEKTNEILHHHEVSQISYIASDDTDNRTFGYVSDVPNKAHQFICFKTSGPAMSVMSVISALFESVLERKNKQEAESKDKKQEEQQHDNSQLIETITSSNPIDVIQPPPPKVMSDNSSKAKKQDLFDDLFGGDLVIEPSSLPKPAIISPTSDGFGIRSGHNRSLIYNHSSVSLSDAALTRQSTFNFQASPTQNININQAQQQQQRQKQKQADGVIDRYSVFNDIDSLPSIFESTSLGNVSKMQSAAPSANNFFNASFTATATRPQPPQFKHYQQQQQQQPPPPPQPLEPLIAGFNDTGSSIASAFNVSNSSTGSIFSGGGGGNLTHASASASGAWVAPETLTAPILRQQTNPFDDDFFA